MNIWAYIISSLIWIGFIFHWIFGSIPKHKIFEIFAGCSIGICLTLTIFGLFGWYQNVTYSILQIIGTSLIFITIFLSIFSLMSLKRKGKPKIGVENTTTLINNTIFGIIRHPLYLGFALWGIGQILSIQSIISVILGVIAVYCSWMASKKEDDFNLKKFEDEYKDYMKNVPMWNFLKNLIRLH